MLHIYSTVIGDLTIHRSTILTLWRAGLTHHSMPEAKLDWYYHENPQGNPTVYLLQAARTAKSIAEDISVVPAHSPTVATNETVAVAAIGVRDMRLDASTLSAGALVDFVAHPDHRTLFPALHLQKTVRQYGLLAHSLLYGFPNASSLAVVRRSGYSQIGNMVRRVKVLRTAEYIGRHVPNRLGHIIGYVVDHIRLGSERLRWPSDTRFQAGWLDRPDHRFDQLWDASLVPNTLMGVRDQAFLNWRFSSCPAQQFKFFCLESEHDFKLVAYAVCESQSSTLHVRDFLVDATMRGVLKSLFLALSRAAYKEGYAAISVSFLGNNRIHDCLSAIGFIERGSAKIYGSATEQFKKSLDAQYWYITSADEDW